MIAFWDGFEKQALTEKLLARASHLARKANKAVHESASQGRPFHGPIAAKFDAQAKIFHAASYGNRKAFNKDRLRVRAGKFTHPTSGGRIKNMLKGYFDKNKGLSKDILKGAE